MDSPLPETDIEEGLVTQVTSAEHLGDVMFGMSDLLLGQGGQESGPVLAK